MTHTHPSTLPASVVRVQTPLAVPEHTVVHDAPLVVPAGHAGAGVAGAV
jgi:hypothetical protein